MILTVSKSVRFWSTLCAFDISTLHSLLYFTLTTHTVHFDPELIWKCISSDKLYFGWKSVNLSALYFSKWLLCYNLKRGHDCFVVWTVLKLASNEVHWTFEALSVAINLSNAKIETLSLFCQMWPWIICIIISYFASLLLFFKYCIMWSDLIMSNMSAQATPLPPQKKGKKAFNFNLL